MASILYKNENELLATAEDPEWFYRKVVMPDKLSINLDYVSKHNMWFDIELIFKTIFSILK